MIDLNKLGVVVAGSLGEGVKVRLNSTSSVEGIKVGSNVVIQGRENRFFGVVTDIALESSDPSLQFNLPDVSDKFIRDTLSGTSAYGAITVEPMLTIGIDQQSDSTGPMPAKTIIYLSQIINISIPYDIFIFNL